jgi:hypothetical protein
MSGDGGVGVDVFLVGELDSIEIGVETFPGQQAGVGTALDDSAIVDDQQLIGLPNR